MNHCKSVGFNFSRYGAHINRLMWQISLQSRVEFLHDSNDMKTIKIG